MPAQLSVPKPSQSRAAILRVIRSALIARGVPNPNVTSTSDYFVTAEALSQQLSVLFANLQIEADAMMPDTAEEDDLVRIASFFGIDARPEQSSHGNIVLRATLATFIPVGLKLLDGNGQTYQVTVGGTYVDGDLVPIESISTGTGTNLPQGSPLQWVGSPPSTGAPVVLVAIGGLIDGSAADSTETIRDRLLDHLRNPPGAGNWTQIAQWAVDASASVQAAYVYPALNGPSTFGLCVVGPLTWDSTNGWNRGVSVSVLASVQTFVASRVPEYAQMVCKTALDAGGVVPCVDVDISIGLSLPVSSSGGGPGGGWTDAIPWPELLGTATRAYVSGVTSSTVITLTSDDPASSPRLATVVVGQTQVAWFSSQQFADGNDPVIVATVIAATGTTGSIQITLSKPFTGIAINDMVFPSAENVQAYARAFMASMNDLGPGEWTSHPVILVHASRRPLTIAANPSDLTATLIRAMTDAGDEVKDAAFLFRSTTFPGYPADTLTVSPNILVPGRVAFFNRIN